MVRGAVDPQKVIVNEWDREDVMFLVKNFLPRLLMGMALPVLFYFMSSATTFPQSVRIIIALLFGGAYLLLFAVCMVFLIVRSNNARKRFNGMVERCGADQLKEELKDDDCRTFMLHPDKPETYVVLTKNFLIFSRENVFRLDEIKQYEIDKNTRGDTAKPYDPSNKKLQEQLRFVRALYITLNNGERIKCNAGLESDELRELNNALKDVLQPGAAAGTITRFYYGYQGSIGANSYHYDIKSEGGINAFEEYEMEHDEYGTLHDIYNQRWYTCTFVNIRLEQNKDGYPTYRCDSVNPEPPGGRDIACDIVDVRS